MYKKKFILIIFLSIIFILLFCPKSNADFLYEKEFNLIFDNLIKNCWDENGDWKEDMMGDANWFATALLFEMGLDKNREDFINIATKSAEWEKKLFDDFMKGWKSGKMPKNVVETIGGLPGLFYGYKFTKRDDFKKALEESMEISYSLSKNPSFDSIIKSVGFDYIVLLAATSYSCSQIYQESNDKKYKEYALSLIDIADIVYWDEDEKYYGILWDWAEGSMLLALAGVYQITNEEKYLSRAKELLSTIIDKMWDKEEGGIKTPKHFELKDAKVLSGNNLFTMALIEWYKLTKDKIFLDYAEKTINFVLSPTLFEGKIIYHHFDKNGRAKYYCTGCIFHTLLNIYRLSQWL